MQSYEKFIDENKVYFEARLKEASNKSFRVFGFPVHSAKEAFQVIVDKTDLYYLPYCLYLIQFGLGVSKDKAFSTMAFRELLPNESYYSDMPILAYVHAYCENRDGDLNLSENIVNYLTLQNFPPALATHGDLTWMQKDKEQAGRYYLHSASLGHIVAKTRHTRLFKKGTNFFLRLQMFLGVSIKTLSDKTRGGEYVYLDFYGFKK